MTKLDRIEADHAVRDDEDGRVGRLMMGPLHEAVRLVRGERGERGRGGLLERKVLGDLEEVVGRRDGVVGEGAVVEELLLG